MISHFEDFWQLFFTVISNTLFVVVCGKLSWFPKNCCAVSWPSVVKTIFIILVAIQLAIGVVVFFMQFLSMLLILPVETVNSAYIFLTNWPNLSTIDL